jgi:hypothetical protein
MHTQTHLLLLTSFQLKTACEDVIERHARVAAAPLLTFFQHLPPPVANDDATGEDGSDKGQYSAKFDELITIVRALSGVYADIDVDGDGGGADGDSSAVMTTSMAAAIASLRARTHLYLRDAVTERVLHRPLFANLRALISQLRAFVAHAFDAEKVAAFAPLLDRLDAVAADE